MKTEKASSPKKRQRLKGQKYVINSCIKTINYCVKNTLQGEKLYIKVKDDLLKNKIKTHSNAIIWTYLALLKYIPLKQAKQILQKFVILMQRKQSKTINTDKVYRKQKLTKQRKHIRSVKILIQKTNLESLKQSMRQIFVYQKKFLDRLKDMQEYLNYLKIDIDSIEFQQGNAYQWDDPKYMQNVINSKNKKSEQKNQNQIECEKEQINLEQFTLEPTLDFTQYQHNQISQQQQKDKNTNKTQIQMSIAEKQPQFDQFLNDKNDISCYFSQQRDQCEYCFSQKQKLFFYQKHI